MTQSTSVESAALAMSTDCALGHYVSEICFDLNAAQAFYDNIPDTRKPPLENCHVHLSALGLKAQGKWIGHLVKKSFNPKMYGPQVPPDANVFVMIGSGIARTDAKAIDFSQTMADALFSYAKSYAPKRPVLWVQQLYTRPLGFWMTRIVSVVVLTFVTTLLAVGLLRLWPPANLQTVPWVAIAMILVSLHTIRAVLLHSKFAASRSELEQELKRIKAAPPPAPESMARFVRHDETPAPLVLRGAFGDTRTVTATHRRLSTSSPASC